MEAVAISCSVSRRSARSIRPALFPAIRWPCAQVWPCSLCSRSPGFYESLNVAARQLASGLRDALRQAGIPGQVNQAGSLITLFFAAGPVRDYDGAKESNTRLFSAFFHGMLDCGIFLAPSQYEALFVSAAHTSEDIGGTIEAAHSTLQSMSARCADPRLVRQLVSHHLPALHHKFHLL